MLHCDSSFQSAVRTVAAGAQKFRPDATTAMEPTASGVTQRGFRSWHELVVRVVLLGTGCVCVLAGGIGVILPGIPTTPFLLLASWCFSRSSRRFETALNRLPILGTFLKSWQRHRAVTRCTKVVACGLIAAMTTATALLTSTSVVLKAAAVVGAVCGMVIVLRLESIRTEDAAF